MDIKEMWCDGMDWARLRIESSIWLLGTQYWTLTFRKFGQSAEEAEFLGQLSDSQCFGKDSASCM
jgi:hypothetical protein